MLDSFEFSQKQDSVQMWLSQRLPYIDRQSDQEKMALNHLKSLLGTLDNKSKLMGLYACYTSTIDGNYDIENVLGYNVGMSAFNHLAQKCITFHRLRSNPPATPSGKIYKHHHCYDLQPIPLSPSDGVTIQTHISSFDQVYEVWWAVSNAVNNLKHPQINGRFALHVEVGLPSNKKLPSTVKKLVDGIIAGLHDDLAPDPEAVKRLAARMGLTESEIFLRLTQPTNPILGSRSRLIKPFSKFIQWNPNDEACDLMTVVTTDNLNSCTITVKNLDF